MAQVEGIAVSGEFIAGLNDKSFYVIGSPEYVDMPDFKDPEKKQRKLLVPIKLANKDELDYYPNKTSVKVMTKRYGFNMDKWIGHKFEWEINKQKAFGKDQQVLFVTDKELDDFFPIETQK